LLRNRVIQGPPFFFGKTLLPKSSFLIPKTIMEKREEGCQAKDPEGSGGITGFRRRREFTLKKLGARNPYPAEAGWGKEGPKEFPTTFPAWLPGIPTG
jgi:hypothetical protein